MISKRQLMLRLAKRAVNWGEGADFEMKELIYECADGEERDAVFHYYPDLLNQFDEENEDPNYERNFSKSVNNLYKKIKSDISQTLNEEIAKG